MSIFNNGGLISSTLGNFFESAALAVEDVFLTADEKISEFKYGTDKVELTEDNLKYWEKINSKLKGQWDSIYDCPKDSAIAKVASLIDKFIILISTKDEKRKLSVLKELSDLDWDSLSKSLEEISTQKEGEKMIKIPINLTVDKKTFSEEIELPESKHLIGDKIKELIETIEKNTDSVKKDIDRYMSIAGAYIDKDTINEFRNLFEPSVKETEIEEESEGLDFAEAIRRTQEGLNRPLTPLMEPIKG